MAPGGRQSTPWRRARQGAALALWLLAAAWAGDARAQGLSSPLQGDGKQPVLISADDVIYDQETGSVTARGNVQIAQGERVLVADQVNYSERDQNVIATGNVSLHEPDGSVVFSNYMQLKDDMKEGVIDSIRILMSDNSRMAARQGSRTEGNKTTLNRAVYSPCHLCAEDRTRAPIWQIKAYKVVHDQQNKEIRYEDAFLEVFGVPVIYTPYFSHPDPSVKRKAGILPPSIGSSTELGQRIAIPYYWPIAPNRDITVTPIITTKQGLVMAATYRALTKRGSYNVEGSLTYGDLFDSNTGLPTKQGWRGHIFADGQFDLTNDTRWGFKLQRASDETYLRRYRFREFDRLRSELYGETFMGQSYFSVRGYAFQSLRANDDERATPLVLPWVNYSFFGQPDRLGGRLSMDVDALVLERESGVSSRRFSVRGQWQRPFYSRFGEIYTLSLNLRGDGYSTKNVFDPQGQRANDLAGRVLPEMTLEWRLPFVRSLGMVRQMVEPLGSITLAPYGGNPSGIPNEDSTAVEFDEASLLKPNRFAGLDRVESGPRAMAGVRMGLYGQKGGASTFTFGQIFRLKPDPQFGSQTGLSGTRSDYVGRIDILPNEYVDLSHRFRLNSSTMEFEQNEVRAIVGPRVLKFDIGYVQVKGDPSDINLPDRNELYTATRAQLTDNWALTASMRRDLRDGGRTISTGGALVYQDECIELGLLFNRRFTSDRDIKPSTSVNFTVRLLNLG
jgi:LPS-assembly protein